MRAVLAPAQPGYVTLLIKIPEQKQLSFTMSLKLVPSDNGIKAGLLLCSHIPSFTVNGLCPARSPPCAASHRCHQCWLCSEPQGVNIPPPHPLLFSQKKKGFFMDVEGIQQMTDRRFPLQEEILPSSTQPPSSSLSHEFQGREKQLKDIINRSG